ncbi:MAG: hypothetical protein RLO21_13185, partial [Nitratireductor sp.]
DEPSADVSYSFSKTSRRQSPLKSCGNSVILRVENSIPRKRECNDTVFLDKISGFQHPLPAGSNSAGGS